jgi:DNA-binding Xre family transcriptional regulator
VSGSPDCNIGRTFISTFYFPRKAIKANQIIHIYRNPIYLAKEYKQMIDNGQAKNQSDLAQKLGISRARVTQILRLSKLNSLIVQELEKLGDPLESKIITERMLRPFVNKSTKKQKALLNVL